MHVYKARSKVGSVVPTEQSVCASKAWLPGRMSQAYMPLFAGAPDYQKIAWMWLILGLFEHHDIFRYAQPTAVLRGR